MKQQTGAANSAATAPADLFKAGKDQTEAMLAMQKQLFSACEQSNRELLERLKSEADLWSKLTSKLIGTHSLQDALNAYQEFMTQRMQMAAEDGQRISEGGQRLMKALSGGTSSGWPAQGT